VSFCLLFFLTFILSSEQPIEQVSVANLNITAFENAYAQGADCEQCYGSNSTCNVFYWCNLCGPNGESVAQLIAFDGYINHCIGE
ncbi:MAG: hypothetical protein AAGH46_04580, partial [Bacteroidota bacterium]